MAGAKVPLTFRIFKGDQLLREERLSLSVIKLGKVPSAHLKLDDETVSRMHAIIEVNGPGDVSIIDLGSTKGTFVNGHKVNKAKLQSGDTILVGETRIELSISAEEEADEPTRVNTSAAPSNPPGDVIASSGRPMGVPALAQTMAAPPPPRTGSGQVPALSAPLPVAAATYAPPAPSAPPALRPPPGLPGGFGSSAPSSFGAAPAFSTAMNQPSGFAASMAESVDDPGARAVEVAAMLGDSVVVTKHCSDPRGDVNPGLARGVFWSGIALLLVAAFAFYSGYQNAKFNKEYWDYEVNVRKKPGYSVRLRQMPVVYDIMMFGGIIFGLGLAATGTALNRKRRIDRRTPDFRIGTAPGVDFSTEMAPAPDFALVSPHGDEFAFNFGHGMDGEVVIGGQSQSLAELASQGRTSISPIPHGAKIRVRSGKATFLISAVPRGRVYGWGLAQFAMAVVFFLVGAVAVTGISLLIYLFTLLVPVDDTSAGLDLAALEDTSTRTNSTSADDPPPPPDEDKKDDGQNESGGTGTKMALDEGKMGKKDSTRESGQYKMQKTSEEAQLAREQAKEAARNAGILGSTALTQGGAFASLTGTGDISSGFDDSNIYGGLLGNEAGEMNGGFGYGRSGFGPGGGGNGWGTIGTGRYGTIGHGSGTGNGYGVGGGRGNGRGHTAAVPTVSIGSPTANGDLDKAIIRRYIKRNINKIQYCYEKALLADSNLSGTVTVSFFISPNGTVASSSGTGVNGEVAGCVAQVIHEIEFPKPKGGGGVQVNYPFDFRRSGS